MTVSRDDLAAYCNDLLDVEAFKDYTPNGLQVQGSTNITRLVTGVSANQALIDVAVQVKADAVLCHHGFFWRNEDPRVVGVRARRLGALMRADMSLLAYHLPLDAHADFGNSTGLLRALGAAPSERFSQVGWVGELPDAISADAFVELIAAACPARPPVAFLSGPKTIRRVGVLTGGGSGYFEEALAAGVDVFVTGEASEQSQGLARELNGNFVAAGHHETERFGPNALGEHLALRFDLEHIFVDVSNPV